jgi:hypothetical protein
MLKQNDIHWLGFCQELYPFIPSQCLTLINGEESRLLTQKELAI